MRVYVNFATSQVEMREVLCTGDDDGESVKSFALLLRAQRSLFFDNHHRPTSEPKDSPFSRIPFSLSPLVTPVNINLYPRYTLDRKSVV